MTADPTMRGSLLIEREVRGPWSLATSRAFWEGFAPAALHAHESVEELRTVFLAEKDWQRVEAVVRQDDGSARIELSGAGDLDAAAEQVHRFLSLDIDATEWPAVGIRDPVIASAQDQLPGLRPCGFHSPYEAAAWAVLSQRVQIRQAASVRRDLIRRHGEDGSFPTPTALRAADVKLPGRKNEYLEAVAEAALDGLLDGARLRSMDAADAIHEVQQIKGLGPFAAELVVIRGANAPDIMPTAERRLDAELAYQYGADRSAESIAEQWKPFRSWAAVHVRAMREIRTPGSRESSMSNRR